MALQRKITRLVTWFSVILTAAIVLILPLGYFSVSCHHVAGNLETEAEINAGIITQVISENPDMWEFEQIRLEDCLSRRPRNMEKEIRRIVSASGRVVAESRDPLDPPFVTRSAELLDSGHPVGKIEISRSLRPLMTQTLLLGLLMLPLGIGAFLAIRVLPARRILKAEESLRNANVFLHTVMESTTNAIIVTDPDGEKIRHVNGRASAISGFGYVRLMGSAFSSLVEEADAPGIREHLRAVAEGAGEVAFETRIARKDGQTIFVSCGASPLLSGGKISGLVISAEDITERKRMEEELLTVKKLEAVGVLARGIAHDFNNLLTSILGNISIAKMRVGTDDPIYPALEKAEKISLKAGGLTRQLIAFSKAGGPARKKMSVRDVLKNAVEFVGNGSPVAIDVVAADDLYPISADEGQMVQVMYNILVNACEAMPEGGTISIRAGNVHLNAADGFCLPEGDYLRISVADTGKGIPKEILPKVFDPYFSTKNIGNQKGMGLGLAICHSIIRNHNGLIDVESQEGAGTAFHVYMPAWPASGE